MIDIKQGTQIVLNMRLLGRGERYFNNEGRQYSDKDIIAAFGDKRVKSYTVITNPRGLIEIIPVFNEPKQTKRKTKKKSSKKSSKKPVIDLATPEVEELTTRDDDVTDSDKAEEQPTEE